MSSCILSLILIDRFTSRESLATDIVTPSPTAHMAGDVKSHNSGASHTDANTCHRSASILSLRLSSWSPVQIKTIRAPRRSSSSTLRSSYAKPRLFISSLNSAPTMRTSSVYLLRMVALCVATRPPPTTRMLSARSDMGRNVSVLLSIAFILMNENRPPTLVFCAAAGANSYCLIRKVSGLY